MPKSTGPGVGVRAELSGPFVAIDFETSDYAADSACAVALVRVEEGEIVRREVRLIRPPRRQMRFTEIHGIRWHDVANQPPFADVWRELEPVLEGAAFLAAHNARFDRAVLHACCAAAGLEPPPQRFECTVRLARATWALQPARLPDVCRFLGIDLVHHDPASDAEACARIVLAAAAETPDTPPSPRRRPRRSTR